MSQIGKELREIEVQPLSLPEPLRLPEPVRPEPVKREEEVPA